MRKWFLLACVALLGHGDVTITLTMVPAEETSVSGQDTPAVAR